MQIEADLMFANMVAALPHIARAASRSWAYQREALRGIARRADGRRMGLAGSS
jgi:hypothetical protein